MTAVRRRRATGVRSVTGRALLLAVATAVPLAVLPVAPTMAAPAAAPLSPAAPGSAVSSGAAGVLPPTSGTTPRIGSISATDGTASDRFGAPSTVTTVTLSRPGQLAADQVRQDQWQLDVLNARTAWRSSTGQGVTVAVIDSGVDATHPDLLGQVLPGLDLVDPDATDMADPVGHGTTVASLIAGRGDNGRGVVGLAPDAKILPVRVLDEENRYDDALVVAQAVRWAVDNGARVINLSLGGNGDSPALAAALDYAFARDVVVVACTGNVAVSSGTRIWYPAREPGVIAVAGLDRDSDNLWPGSITGPETVLTAPATGLVGARPGGYWRVQGTSFAAPLVAGTAALVRARWPQMPAGEVVNRLIATARDLGPAGRDDRFGFGRVDPVAALTRDVPPVPRNPLDDQLSPGEVGFGRAPGAAEVADSRAGQLGPTDSRPDGWTARAAGDVEVAGTGRFWGAVLVVVILLTGTAVAARRSRHPLRRRTDP